MSDPGYLWYNLFGLFYTQGFPMTPAFPDPFFPLAPCLCVRTRYRKRPPGVRDAFSEAFGTGEGLLRYGMNRTRLLRSVFWLEDAAITNNPAHPNPINSPNHAKTHQLHKSHLLRKNSPTTSNSPNPQKPPCPIKAKRLTDSRRPTLRLCTKT